MLFLTSRHLCYFLLLGTSITFTLIPTQNNPQSARNNYQRRKSSLLPPSGLDADSSRASGEKLNLFGSLLNQLKSSSSPTSSPKESPRGSQSSIGPDSGQMQNLSMKSPIDFIRFGSDLTTEKIQYRITHIKDKVDLEQKVFLILSFILRFDRERKIWLLLCSVIQQMTQD